MEAAEKILQSEDYFRCARQHATMKKAACVEFQREAIKTPFVRRACWDCGQGAAIAAELGEEIKRPERPKTRVCKECGKEKPLNEAHYYVNHRYAGGFNPVCRECFAEKRDRLAQKVKEARDPASSGDCAAARDTEEGNGDESMKKKKVCIVEGCGKFAVARGLCLGCYEAWRRGKEDLVALMGGAYERIRQPRPRKKKKEGKVDPSSPEGSAAASPASGKDVLALDLAHFGDIRKALEERARDELRTVEMQAMYYLKRGIQGSEDSRGQG